ncbi:MAG: hypothetical protein Q4D62_04035 [Planctomycetia bacterium]|nr:hypothetical protein [Planctomycetia bacterium]
MGYRTPEPSLETSIKYGFSESLTPSGGLNGGYSNIEQEIWGLLRSLDSERQTNVLEVLGEILKAEREMGGEGGEENG